jgi:hypothetical protein
MSVKKWQTSRLLKTADQQGGLVTITELSVILNRSYSKVRSYIQEYQAETGEPQFSRAIVWISVPSLPTKARSRDSKNRAKSPPDISHESRYSLKSVEGYLNDYQRVNMLLKDH